MNAECRILNVECRARRRSRLSGVPPSSFLVPRCSRSGISLLEVLISIFVLSFGLLGVASLIPMGKIAITETNKSDRTGACGRAGLHEVKVRGMLNCQSWLTSVDMTTFKLPTIVIDPLGALSIGNMLGPLPRINLGIAGTPLTLPAAQSIFEWHDDLQFVLPKDMKPSRPGDRPLAMFLQGVDGSANPDTNTGVIATVPNVSWFVMVSPVPAETALPTAQRRIYNVAVVVCYKRVLNATGEQQFPATCAGGVGYGGVTVSLPGNVKIKENEWLLLASPLGQTSWYRVANAGYSQPSNTTNLSVVGPDWYGGTSATAVIIDSVSGVYSEVVQLD